MEKKQRYGDLGGDLIRKILVRLPIKYLLQMKSVCKSWCVLIESSFFIDLHTTFNSSSSSNKFGSFILLASLDKYSHETFKTLRKHSLIMLSSSGSVDDSVSRSGSSGGGVGCLWSTGSNHDDQEEEDVDDQLVFKVDNLGGGSNDQLVFKLDSLGFPCIFSLKKIVGSCNGLVCLCDSDLNLVSLWNPATRHHRILPESIPSYEDRPHCLVAFGFDFETKDYKVVLFQGFRCTFYRSVSPKECFCQVQVYSLSTNSWRLLEGITCLPGDPFRFPSEILYLNGSCFFLAYFFHTKQQPCAPENNRFIISFDFTKEIITPIQLPDHHEDHELYLSCLADKIALFTICNPPPLGTYGHNNDYIIWVLNEHGSSSSVNKKSWEKFHSFQIHVERQIQCFPKGISNDGEFALLETIGGSTRCRWPKMMKLYHFATKEVKTDFLSCSGVMSIAYAYKPSLVSIYQGGSSSRISQ